MSAPHGRSPWTYFRKGDPRLWQAAKASTFSQRFGLLEQTPALFELPDGLLRALTRRALEVRLRPAEVLLAAGEVPGSLYVVQSGSCRLSAPASGGGEVELGLAGRGALLGEGVLDRRPSAVTASAVRETVLLGFDAPALAGLLPADAPLFAALARLSEQRERAAAAALRPLLTGTPLVIGVHSPKGGSGKTTIAVNLAACLAARRPGDVVLLDLGLPYNHAALLANVTATGCLARLPAGEGFEGRLREAVVHSPWGIAVLPAVTRPEEAELVGGQVVGRALDVLGGLFGTIVVDLGGGLDDVTLAGLDRCSRLVEVTTPELAAVRDTAHLIQIYGSALALPARALLLVLNNRSPHPALESAVVSRALGAPIALEIAWDGQRAELAALRGELAVESEPDGALGRAIQQLAGLVDPAPRPARKPAKEALPC